VSDLERIINGAWEARDTLSPETRGTIREAVETALEQLDSGQVRVAEKIDGDWITHQWLKKAVLLSFRLHPNRLMPAGEGLGPGWDKVPEQVRRLGRRTLRARGFRACPGAIVRRGASCRPQRRAHALLREHRRACGRGRHDRHLGDRGLLRPDRSQRAPFRRGRIGGVLEPLQANPTVIEDGCFIGARSEVAEGVIVGEGAVLSMGVFLSASTKIVDRATGEVHRGAVPAYSVVVPGALPDPKGGPSLYCAVIVKTVDAQTRAKTGVNELLRD
jgi:2,3,4,5-tetrahydropyridine-2-carboxylate N-succinyltransferase